MTETRQVTEQEYIRLFAEEPGDWKIISYDFDTDSLKIIKRKFRYGLFSPSMISKIREIVKMSDATEKTEDLPKIPPELRETMAEEARQEIDRLKVKEDNPSKKILTVSIDDYIKLNKAEPGRWEIINQRGPSELVIKDCGPVKPTYSIPYNFKIEPVTPEHINKIRNQLIDDFSNDIPREGNPSKMVTKEMTEDAIRRTLSECLKIHESANREYAHSKNALANFERVAERIGITREQVLMVYFEKHVDGIHSYIQGNESQRESIYGRINDAINYLCLVRTMFENPKYNKVYGKGIASVVEMTPVPDWDKD